MREIAFWVLVFLFVFTLVAWLLSPADRTWDFWIILSLVFLLILEFET